MILQDNGLLMEQALRLVKGGSFLEAAAVCKKVLRKHPKHPDAFHLLGIISWERGSHQLALKHLGRAVRLSPENAAYKHNLGNVYQEIGRFEEALAQYAAAIELKSDYFTAYLHRANCLTTLGRTLDAVIDLQKAVALDSSSYTARINLAAAYIEARKYDDAIRLLNATEDVHNDHKKYQYLAISHFRQNQFEQALVSLNGALATSLSRLPLSLIKSACLFSLGRYEEGLEVIDGILTAHPTSVAALRNRGTALLRLKRYPEAAGTFEKLLALQPDAPDALGLSLHAKGHACDWSGLEENLQSLEASIEAKKQVTPAFAALALTDSAALLQNIVQLKDHTHNSGFPDVEKMSHSADEGRILIGYFSSDFHNHATAYLISELIEIHDRSRFKIIGFSFGPSKRDRMQKRLISAFDEFHDVQTMSDQEIAVMSREIGIDIAVDLKGYTTNCRTGIFSHRCAPIQVNYLGYPGTMGANFIDYLIADHVLICPQTREHYSESIVYMPDSYQVNDRRRAVPELKYTKASVGLPETGFVFCCFNNNYKIMPNIFDAWMRILQLVPDSVLWLFRGNDSVEKNLRESAQVRGVSPDRLIFADPMDPVSHLSRLSLADLFLDTFPCNAHTTASDALWAGVPVLTLSGQSFQSRVAASLLSALNLHELITKSIAEYEALAQYLALNPEKLQKIRSIITSSKHSAPLFDTPRFAAHIESAYELMIDRFRRKLEPHDLYIEPACSRACVSDSQAVPMRIIGGSQSINSIGVVKLKEMEKLVKSIILIEGLDNGFKFVSRIRASDGRHSFGQVAILSAVARSMFIERAPNARHIVDRIKDAYPGYIAPYVCELNYLYNSGDASRARQVASYVFHSQESSHDDIIFACMYLSRLSPDLPIQHSLEQAYEALGCPVSWASVVLQIALEGMNWDLADKVIRQLNDLDTGVSDPDTHEMPRTNLLWCGVEKRNIVVSTNWNKRVYGESNASSAMVVGKPLVGRRLRVAYLSSDFRKHPTSYLIKGLLKEHDRTNVELVGYCSGWDDGSDIRKEVLSYFSDFHCLSSISDPDAVKLIRSHEIDVLIDLNGPTAGHRMEILAARCAPVQIHYLGYPGSLGGGLVDYIVADRYTVPDSSVELYPEKVIRISSTYQLNDYASFEPLPPVTRGSQDLPENVPIIGVFNAINKVRLEVWVVWMKIMREVPNAILWILDPGPACYDVIKKVSNAYGVRAGRIHIAPKVSYKDHLARIQCADIMLDPWPYGGHTTTSDSLFSGVPVLAMSGTNFASRVSGSLLRAAGLECLVQPTKEDYVRIAILLLKDRPDELVRLKSFLRRHVLETDVFQARGKARQLEDAYRMAFQRVLDGLGHKSFDM